MRHKVVYNACFGGFSLSREAVLLGRELSGDPNWGGPCIIGDLFPENVPVEQDFGNIEGVKRHDPILVQVIEKLGPKANGQVTKLEIVEIVGNKYRVDEYDGNEIVLEPDDDIWEVI